MLLVEDVLLTGVAGSDVLVSPVVRVVLDESADRPPAVRVVLVVVDGGRWVGLGPKIPTPSRALR